MGKPVRPVIASSVVKKIIRDMEHGEIEYTQAITAVQRLRLNEHETYRTIVYLYDYERWNRSRTLTILPT